MTKIQRNLLLVLADIILINLAMILAFFIRFDWTLPPQEIKAYKEIVIWVLSIRLVTFYFFGLYRWSWRYASISEFLSIIKAITLGTIVITAFVFFYRKLGYPRSVLAIDWLLNLVFIGGLRSLPRILLYLKRPTPLGAKRALIIGAGDTGEMIVREMQNHPEANYLPVGLIDDARVKQGTYIHGVKVMGTREEIPSIVEGYGIDEIIIALSSPPGRVVREIVKHCEKAKVKFKIVPAIHEIITGEVSINQIREVQPEDLLGRSEVKINLEEISAYLTNKRVLITGAGGTIGSELTRQVAKFNPSQLILLGQGENSIYHIDIELKEKHLNFSLFPVICNIQDRAKIERVMERFTPQVIFHTAAHKHVPLMEANPEEAIKTNIIGTKNLVEAAQKYKVERLVMVSTDKAVNPTSIMGASKKVAEWIIQSFAQNKKETKFMVVRFGNVLASRGSVIPLFKRQIANGGPITVTHPEATRYFMTIGEAAQLVIQAGALGEGGEVFILDMGDPIKILDLARNLITLSGLEPEEDIPIKFTGLRPGEKLHEELLTPEEGVSATKHEKIFVINPESIDRERLARQIKELEILAEKAERELIKRKLKEIVPAYRPSESI